PYWNRGPRHHLQNLVSALLVLAVVIQILTLLVPLETIAGQPAIVAALTAALVAVALHLAVSFYRSSPSPVAQ
ncbi:cold shock domain-containing protein membrane protein, partial [Pseudomonas quasicaspiana]|nr:cold shock domain-containing protein membrane protein [Pseudomonas quasicaspiana]